MMAVIEGANSGLGRGRCVPGPGGVGEAVSAAGGTTSWRIPLGWRIRLCLRFRANTRASSGSWSQINQPPGTGTDADACRVCALALSTGILLAPLDAAESKTNSRPHHPI